VHVEPATSQQHGNAAEASQHSPARPYAADTRASLPFLVVMEIKLQSRTLRVDASSPKSLSF
jgi:hypothetical protein